MEVMMWQQWWCGGDVCTSGGCGSGSGGSATGGCGGDNNCTVIGGGGSGSGSDRVAGGGGVGAAPYTQGYGWYFGPLVTVNPIPNFSLVRQEST